MKKKIIFYSGVLMAVLALTGCADKAQNNNDKADYTFAEKDSTAEESSEITSADTAGQESTKKLTTATETVTTTTINTTIKETTKPTTTKTTGITTAQTTKAETEKSETEAKNVTTVQTNDNIQWHTGNKTPILTTVPATIANVNIKISDDSFTTEKTDYVFTDEQLDLLADTANNSILRQLSEQNINIAYLKDDFVFGSWQDSILQTFDEVGASISKEQFDIFMNKVNYLFNMARVEAINNELGITFERIDDNTVKRIYTYLEVDGSIWNNSIELFDSGYEFCHKQPRYKYISEWVNYIYENEELLDKIAGAIMSTSDSLDKTEYQLLLDAVAYVQSIPYVSDIDSTGYEEFPKYPYETLYENCGDCEDVSILLAGLLRSMGYGVCLVTPPGHMAVGVKTDDVNANFYLDGQGYYYIECTDMGWNVGQVPEDCIGAAKAYYIS